MWFLLAKLIANRVLEKKCNAFFQELQMNSMTGITRISTPLTRLTLNTRFPQVPANLLRQLYCVDSNLRLLSKNSVGQTRENLLH